MRAHLLASVLLFPAALSAQAAASHDSLAADSVKAQLHPATCVASSAQRPGVVTDRVVPGGYRRAEIVTVTYQIVDGKFDPTSVVAEGSTPAISDYARGVVIHNTPAVEPKADATRMLCTVEVLALGNVIYVDSASSSASMATPVTPSTASMPKTAVPASSSAGGGRAPAPAPHERVERVPTPREPAPASAPQKTPPASR